MRPAMIRSKVVLPQPLGPMTVRNSLSRTSQSMLLSASTPLLPLSDGDIGSPSDHSSFDGPHRGQQGERFYNNREYGSEYEVRLHSPGEFQEQAAKPTGDQEQLDHNHARD